MGLDMVHVCGETVWTRRSQCFHVDYGGAPLSLRTVSAFVCPLSQSSLVASTAAELSLDVTFSLDGQDGSALLGGNVVADAIDTGVTGGLSFSISASPTVLVAAGKAPRAFVVQP